MEAMTTVTAAFLDRGLRIQMRPLCVVKVVYDRTALGMHQDRVPDSGGSALLHRSAIGKNVARARINQIGEGAKEVLTSFICVVGMRGPGMEFKRNLRHVEAVKPFAEWK